MLLAPLKTLVLATTLVGALAIGAAAQERDGGWWPRWGMGQGMMGGGGSWGPVMVYGTDALRDRIDGRLAFLKTELRIAPAKEQAWYDLATVIGDTGETHNK